MSVIIKDFFQLGALRFISRFLMGLRGLFIVVSLSPRDLGEYTIWLLFVFYFSMLDFGVLSGLERDIPHYGGLRDEEEVKRRASVGWSSFFVLSGAASLLLVLTGLIVFKEWILAVLLGAYLLTNKIYRSYNTSSRIHMFYKENGIAQLIYAIVSLAIVIALLPVWGAYGILVAFIIASMAGSLFLFRKTKLVFHWSLKLREAAQYVKSSFSLAVIVYSSQFYHMAALTILAILCDKSTLGYFAFAFRIFQILLTLFPFLIQEVMRTRMYFQVAQRRHEKSYLENLFYPMGIYCILTSLVWIFIYWWADWGVHRFAPVYAYSIETLKILTLTLLPLGITKICSDFLCSNLHKKSGVVVLSWLFGIVIQSIGIYFAGLGRTHMSFTVPSAYLISTLVIYLLIIRASLNVQEEAHVNGLRLTCLWLPLVIALSAVYILKKFFLFLPSPDFYANLAPFLASVLFMIVTMRGIVFLSGKYKCLNVFCPMTE